MIQYTVKTDVSGGEYVEAIEGDTLMIIPVNTDNSDYQAYLKYLDESK